MLLARTNSLNRHNAYDVLRQIGQQAVVNLLHFLARRGSFNMGWVGLSMLALSHIPSSVAHTVIADQ